MTDRARVPFALVGVLLLVSSATFVATEHRTPARQPSVDEAIDGLAAAAQTAVRSGVRTAARRAAARPVLDPANSTFGAQLDSDRPFVDALKLRIYVRVRANLDRLDHRRRGLTVAAELPAIESPADAGRAIERVNVESAGSDGSALRVTIEGIELRADREGRTVGRAQSTPTLVVHTPVLFVHDRVERFDRRLDAPVTEPGLARRLTAVLYPVAWARGYAQLRGLPVENVVANDHLELLANGAALSLQRSAFGRVDSLGHRVYAETLAETVVTEFLGATAPDTLERLERLRSKTERLAETAESIPQIELPSRSPEPRDRTTVGINRSADLAYLRAVEQLNRTLAETYRPRVRIRADVDRRDRTTRADPRPTGDRDRLSVITHTRTTVSNRSGDPPSPATGSHALATYGRTVTIETRRVSTWGMPGNETATSSRTTRTIYAVDLLVAENHTVGPAPAGPITTVHESGGPLDGKNLADVPALAKAEVTRRGGVDALAERAVEGTLDSSRVRVDADVPDGLAGWVRPDLTRLHRRVRNISVSVRQNRVATFESNVPRLLAERLRDRRERLIDAPDRYPDVAHRARVGVRAAYVDRVLERLDRAAVAHDRGRDRLANHLPNTGRPPSQLLAAGRSASPVVADRPETPIRMAVAASPSYLTLEAVGGADLPGTPRDQSEYPLVARNLNAFSVPTTDVVDALFGALSGPETTSVRTAAQALRVANRSEIKVSNASAVRDDLDETAHTFHVAAVRILRRHDLGDRRSRAAVVSTALDRWGGPGPRAGAVANGSAPTAVHRVAVDRWPKVLSTESDRERLSIDLESAARVVASSPSARPGKGAVNGTVREIVDDLGLADRVTDAVDERAVALAARLPSGMPVIPAAGLWYATVNVWHVQVRGSYARFVVRVPRGAPDRLPADFRYVRENRTVSFDVDGDGNPERLGRNHRIDFRTETAVGVAVPPRPAGVGDVGDRDERSPGWPRPGPTDE